jgi:hypothetical protein
MADIDPLLRELQTTNGLTRELLKEKREDDTPKSLFMGNMFEIFNARALQTSDQKFIKNERMDQVDNLLENTNKILKSLTAGMSGMTGFVKQSVENTKASVKALPKVIEDLKRNTENMVNKPFKAIGKFMSDKIGEPLSKQFNALRVAYAINTMKFKGKEKEDKKDRESLFRYFFGGIVDSLKNFGKNIVDGFKGLKDSLLGKAGLATALLALGAFLVSKFPALAEAVGNVTMAFVDLAGDTSLLLKGEKKVGDYLADNFLTLLGTSLFLFRKKIFAFFSKYIMANIALIGRFFSIQTLKVGAKAALVGAGKVALLLGAKIVAIGAAIIGGVMGFFQEYSREYARSDSFFAALGVGMLGIIKGAIAGVLYVLEAILSFVTFGLLDFDLSAIIFEFDIGEAIRNIFSSVTDYFENFSITDPSTWLGGNEPEGKLMGGPVAAGTPYMVGEQGMELFVPGAAGSIIPNNMLGGGAPIIVTNNNVSAPTNTHSHQHSNVSITDNQQEITGL